MKIVGTTKWKQAYSLKGKIIMVKTIYEQTRDGKIFTRRVAMIKKAS